MRSLSAGASRCHGAQRYGVRVLPPARATAPDGQPATEARDTHELCLLWRSASCKRTTKGPGKGAASGVRAPTSSAEEGAGRDLIAHPVAGADVGREAAGWGLGHDAPGGQLVRSTLLGDAREQVGGERIVDRAQTSGERGGSASRASPGRLALPGELGAAGHGAGPVGWAGVRRGHRWRTRPQSQAASSKQPGQRTGCRVSGFGGAAQLCVWRLEHGSADVLELVADGVRERAGRIDQTAGTPVQRGEVGPGHVPVCSARTAPRAI